MATYTVYLVNPKRQLDTYISVDEDLIILAAAED